ncbi:MAG: serine hydrolase domain-containing protein [Amylibacter sp.]
MTSSKFKFVPARLQRIADWMDGYVTDRKFAGSSVLINRGGQEAYFNAAGLRDVENGLPFERDTIARIYSMTKPITSVAIMMLVEKGLIHLEAPLCDFVPEFANCTALIKGATSIDQTEPSLSPTLHQLLTHTSGLTYPFNPGILPKAMEAKDLIFKGQQGPLADVVLELATLPLAFQPGLRWEYSVSMDVLGRVIEVVSGQPLDVFLQENILDPLGMSETRFSVPEGALDRFASLYTPLSGNAMDLNSVKTGSDTLRLVDSAPKTPFTNTKTFSGGGGLVGTIDDYMRFCEMFRQGGVLGETRLLSPLTVEFMGRNHLSGDIADMGPSSFAEQPMEGMGFGLGGSVLRNPGRVCCPGSVGDFSWGGMASTFFWIDPVLDMSVVFFTQLSPSSSYPARAQLKAIIHGALV